MCIIWSMQIKYFGELSAQLQRNVCVFKSVKDFFERMGRGEFDIRPRSFGGTAPENRALTLVLVTIWVASFTTAKFPFPIVLSI